MHWAGGRRGILRFYKFFFSHGRGLSRHPPTEQEAIIGMVLAHGHSTLHSLSLEPQTANARSHATGIDDSR
eukprot:scaffold6758_cov116-Isochrysis_galbana.AAC.2